MDFTGFPKILRWSKELAVVSEKIDGTNASIYITDSGDFLTASRNRWITPQDDNYGFSKWAHDNKNELLELGVGRHFGEWYGSGIQRNYGLTEKRFALFNSGRWANKEDIPSCVSVVPILKKVQLQDLRVQEIMDKLKLEGSAAVPGFRKPEGIVIYLSSSKIMFKKTFEKDNEGKGQS
jgi:hypothetical protein